MTFLKGKRRGGLEIKMVQKGAKRRERKITMVKEGERRERLQMTVGGEGLEEGLGMQVTMVEVGEGCGGLEHGDDNGLRWGERRGATEMTMVKTLRGGYDWS
jgi:hypothetical protein